MEWERTFDVAAEPKRAWQEFAESNEPQAWNNAFRGDPYFSNGAVRVEIQERDPERLLRWEESEGDDRVEMTVTFTETETGTRITIVRSGFGEGEDWAARHSARLLGWTEAMHDFAVYLATGIALDRLHFLHWRVSSQMAVVDVAGGLRVVWAAPGGWAATAGLEPGDLLVRIAGAPVFDRSDLWLLQVILEPGTNVSVEYVRAQALHQAVAPI